MVVNEHGAKAILREPRSVKNEIPISWPSIRQQAPQRWHSKWSSMWVANNHAVVYWERRPVRTAFYFLAVDI
jgi:hypothetical protein